MRYAICNETFEGWDHARICKLIAGLGYTGLEIAPFTLAGRITDVSAEPRRELERQADDHGVDSHRPALAAGEDDRAGPHLDGCVSASGDGGLPDRTGDAPAPTWAGDILVFGSPAQRRIPAGATHEQATDNAVDTFRRAAPAIGDLGVKLCLEPLSPPDANFINTAPGRSWN